MGAGAPEVRADDDVPTPSGFSVGQAAVMQLAMWGIGMARAVYTMTIKALVRTPCRSQPLSYPAQSLLWQGFWRMSCVGHC